MARKYKAAHMARRIRRSLEATGLKAEVHWIDCPGYKTNMPERLLETVVEIDGKYHTLHHTSRMPATDDDIMRIVLRVVDDPGPDESCIKRVLERYGKSLICEEGAKPIIHAQHGCATYIYVSVRLLDILGNEHTKDMQEVYSDPYNLLTLMMKQEIQNWRQSHLNADKRRRKANVQPKPIMIGSTFANLLRSHPDGERIARAIIPNLQAALAKSDLPNGMSNITVVEASSGDEASNMQWSIKGQNVHLRNYQFTGGMIDGDTLIVKGTIPNATAIGMKGRRLDQLVTGTPMDPSLIITRAHARRSPWSGVSIKLEGKPIAPDDLIRELSAARIARLQI